jgi:hypothetical protein
MVLSAPIFQQCYSLLHVSIEYFWVLPQKQCSYKTYLIIGTIIKTVFLQDKMNRMDENCLSKMSLCIIFSYAFHLTLEIIDKCGRTFV